MLRAIAVLLLRQHSRQYPFPAWGLVMLGMHLHSLRTGIPAGTRGQTSGLYSKNSAQKHNSDARIVRVLAFVGCEPCAARFACLVEHRRRVWVSAGYSLAQSFVSVCIRQEVSSCHEGARRKASCRCGICVPLVRIVDTYRRAQKSTGSARNNSGKKHTSKQSV